MNRTLIPSLACVLLSVTIFVSPSLGPSSANAAAGSGDRSNADAAFERLSSLVGSWESEENAYDGYKIKLSYSLVSAGKALMERFRLGYTEHEMVTIYHLDDDGLGMHHFCEVGNQVRLHADLADADADSITFSFVDATNLANSSSQIVDRLTISFHDPDHITQDWRWKLDRENLPFDFAEYTFTRLDEDGSEEPAQYGSDR